MKVSKNFGFWLSIVGYNVNAHTHIVGIVRLTRDPFGPIKDTSNVDGGKIRSALTLEINCSTDQADREPCSNSTRRKSEESENGKEKRRVGRRKEGLTRIGSP